MSTLVLLEGFAAELVRHGLPVEYAKSTATELSDHYRDLVEELRTSGLGELEAETVAGERLGERRVLVKEAVREFQRRHWCARWPLLTFFIGPIPLVLLTCVAITLASICIAWPLQLLGVELDSPPDGIISTGERLSVYLAQALYVFLAPALVLVLLVRRSNRAALGSQWPLLSALLLAMFAGMFLFDFIDVAKVQGPADRVLMVMCIPLLPSWSHTWRWYMHDPIHICQWVLPLVLGVTMVLRNRQLAIRSLRLVTESSD